MSEKTKIAFVIWRESTVQSHTLQKAAVLEETEKTLLLAIPKEGELGPLPEDKLYETSESGEKKVRSNVRQLRVTKDDLRIIEVIPAA